MLSSPRKESSAATVTATPAWQPAEKQPSCSPPEELASGGELSFKLRASLESSLFITTPSLSPGKTKCNRECSWRGFFSSGWWVCLGWGGDIVLFGALLGVFLFDCYVKGAASLLPCINKTIFKLLKWEKSAWSHILDQFSQYRK